MTKKFNFKGVVDSLNQSQSFIHTQLLATRGWDATIENLDVLARPQVFLYVLDKLTGFKWMASVAADEFNRLSSEAHSNSFNDDIKLKAIRDNLGKSIHLASLNDNPKLNEEFKRNLTSALTMYAGTTQTWDLSGRFKSGGHFIVMNYRNGHDDSMLRPFSVPVEAKHPISTEEFAVVTNGVIALDKANHPEWFTL